MWNTEWSGEEHYVERAEEMEENVVWNMVRRFPSRRRRIAEMADRNSFENTSTWCSRRHGEQLTCTSYCHKRELTDMNAFSRNIHVLRDTSMGKDGLETTFPFGRRSCTMLIQG